MAGKNLTRRGVMKIIAATAMGTPRTASAEPADQLESLAAELEKKAETKDDTDVATILCLIKHLPADSVPDNNEFNHQKLQRLALVTRRAAQAGCSDIIGEIANDFPRLAADSISMPDGSMYSLQSDIVNIYDKAYRQGLGDIPTDTLLAHVNRLGKSYNDEKIIAPQGVPQLIPKDWPGYTPWTEKHQPLQTRVNEPTDQKGRQIG